MIHITTVVWIFLFLLGAGCIFALLFYLISYIEKQFPTEQPTLFFKFARILLVVCAILVLIGVILDLMGAPLIIWRKP